LSSFPGSGLKEDPSLHLAAFVCWTQVELYWSIISATIPSMRPFLRGLSTTETTIFEDSTGHASRTGYELSKMRSRSKSSRLTRFTATKDSGKRSQHSQSQSAIEMGPLPERREVHAPSRTGSRLRHNLPSTFRTDRGSISSGSNESQHMIIRKDVSWTVDHDGQ
jgi:hypothetical protein